MRAPELSWSHPGGADLIPSDSRERLLSRHVTTTLGASRLRPSRRKLESGRKDQDAGTKGDKRGEFKCMDVPYMPPRVLWCNRRISGPT